MYANTYICAANPDTARVAQSSAVHSNEPQHVTTTSHTWTVMSSKQISSVLDGTGSAEDKLTAIRALLAAETSSGKSREKIANMSSEVRDDNPYR